MIAGEAVDGDKCAADLLGQAEGGADRCCVLLTTAAYARARWEGYGQVIVCDDHDERLAVAKDVALFKEPRFAAAGSWHGSNLAALGRWAV